MLWEINCYVLKAEGLYQCLTHEFRKKRENAGDFAICLEFKPGPRHFKPQFTPILWNTTKKEGIPCCLQETI